MSALCVCLHAKDLPAWMGFDTSFLLPLLENPLGLGLTAGPPLFTSRLETTLGGRAGERPDSCWMLRNARHEP